MSATLLAWLVHLYTAAATRRGCGMAVLIVRGGDDGFRWAFLLMAVADGDRSDHGRMVSRAKRA